MAGIINRTARQFNLKCITKAGQRVIVRLAPGFNVVEDAHWEAFVPKKGPVDEYVAGLKKKGDVVYGDDIDDLELEQDPDTKSKSKSEPIAKIKSDLAKANKEAEVQKDEATKAKEEAKEATAKAEKAELELEQLKKSIAEGTKADKPESKNKG